MRELLSARLIARHLHLQPVLLWGVGGHGGINGDHGTFRVHHHDGGVPAVGKESHFSRHLWNRIYLSGVRV